MPRKIPPLNTRAASPVASDSDRPTTAQRGYGGRWQRTRRAKLAASPLCETCEANGVTAAAREVDHIDGLGPIGERGHDLDNLMSLCKPCHARKTVLCDGGFGRARRAATGASN